MKPGSTEEQRQTSVHAFFLSIRSFEKSSGVARPENLVRVGLTIVLSFLISDASSSSCAVASVARIRCDGSWIRGQSVEHWPDHSKLAADNTDRAELLVCGWPRKIRTEKCDECVRCVRWVCITAASMPAHNQYIWSIITRSPHDTCNDPHQRSGSYRSTWLLFEEIYGVSDWVVAQCSSGLR